ncbi:hypothetical protein KQX54_021366 [Cotesia glomerata]|uniref:Uncharacterized protein n=1 Tax=Cotesia glomerata TaxID=32391 RepID=A0AAV7J9I1_COTGL|nr:hypothetical protein KQX54_021366 [Cotesia glomerata]
MVFFTRISARDKKKIEQPVDYMDIVRKGALTIAEKSSELWLKFVAFFRIKYNEKGVREQEYGRRKSLEILKYQQPRRHCQRLMNNIHKARESKGREERVSGCKGYCRLFLGRGGKGDGLDRMSGRLRIQHGQQSYEGSQGNPMITFLQSRSFHAAVYVH